MWIGRNEILGARMNVGEVAAPTTRDRNLLSDAVRVFQQQNAAAALACFDCAEEPGRSTTYHYNFPASHQLDQAFRRVSLLALAKPGSINVLASQLRFGFAVSTVGYSPGFSAPFKKVLPSASPFALN